MRLDDSADNVELRVTVWASVFGLNPKEIYDRTVWVIRLNAHWHSPILLNRKYEIGRRLPLMCQIAGEGTLQLDVPIKDLKKIFIRKNQRKWLFEALRKQERGVLV